MKRFLKNGIPPNNLGCMQEDSHRVRDNLLITITNHQNISILKEKYIEEVPGNSRKELPKTFINLLQHGMHHKKDSHCYNQKTQFDRHVEQVV
jgi:hypothetical protein